MICEIVSQYMPLADQDVKALAFMATIFQCGGFLVIVHDMWPLYKKEKSIQYIYWIVGFSRRAKQNMDKDYGFGTVTMIANATTPLLTALDNLAKYEPSLKVEKKEIFLDKEKFPNFHNSLEEKYEEIIQKIKLTPVWRNWYVGEAVALIVLGYLMQLLTVIPC